MAIPDFQSIMRPLLEAHSDGNEHVNRDLVTSLADHFSLTDDERSEMLPSGGARLFDNRLGWAKTHMLQAGLISAPRRAISVITPRGRELLAKHPSRIDLKVLGGIEAYRELRNRKRSENPPSGNSPEEIEKETPEEQFEDAYLKMRQQVESEILRLVMESPPDFLERVVVDLIVRMGYGGSRKDAGKALGKTGDEGIDGIIKEDPLGLDVIYLQAKRWSGTVGRPEIQKFAGALQGQRANKGIFITTSGFSSEAEEFVSRIGAKIILIDGIQLARLMFDHGIGVATATSYEVKRIDSDYFGES